MLKRIDQEEKDAKLIDNAKNMLQKLHGGNGVNGIQNLTNLYSKSDSSQPTLILLFISIRMEKP